MKFGPTRENDDSWGLLPCPFCGGAVTLELAKESIDVIYGPRRWWGVVCRNTGNVGGTCCMEQVPSASKRAAVSRWNMRNGVSERLQEGEE